MPSSGSPGKNTPDPSRSRNPILLLSQNYRSCRPSFGSRDDPAPQPTHHRIPSHERALKTVGLGPSVDMGKESLRHMRREAARESLAVLVSSFLAQRLWHGATPERWRAARNPYRIRIMSKNATRPLSGVAIAGLFDLGPTRQLSPYKEWERRNRIKTHFAPHCEEEPWTAARTFKTVAEVAMEYGDSRLGQGATRDAAIADLCRKLAIPVYGSNDSVVARPHNSESQPKD
mgnify:CR=1 FL=1